MRFTFHIGLHCTDEDRALTCLLKNAGKLAAERCEIPRPGRFRPALREAMLAQKGDPAQPDMQQRLLDAMLTTDRPAHVLFSSDSFLCVPHKAFAGGELYPLTAERAPWIRQLFPSSEVHFCLAVRNPATWLPSLYDRIAEELPFERFLEGVDPEALRWSDMIRRLRRAVPDAAISVWCHEDAPVLWPEILSLLAGRTTGTAHDLAGWDAFPSELMVPQAQQRMRSYLESAPTKDAAHRRRVIAAFLDRFAIESAVEEHYDLPGWSAERVGNLTEIYEADLVRIERMPGIEFMQL